MLEDPARRLWAGVGLPHLDNLPARTPLGGKGSAVRRPKNDLDVVRQLDAVLDRLEKLVEAGGLRADPLAEGPKPIRSKGSKPQRIAQSE